MLYARILLKLAWWNRTWRSCHDVKIHSWCTVCRWYLKSCQGETALLRARAIRGMTHAQIKGINRCRPGDWGSLVVTPKWMVYNGKSLNILLKSIKMDDLGVPPRIFGNHHMVSCNVRCYSKQTILWEQPWQNLEHAPCTASPAHICISCAYLAHILISCAYVVYASAVQGPVETQPLAVGKLWIRRCQLGGWSTCSCSCLSGLNTAKININ